MKVSGDDTAAGTSEADAFATIDKAASTATAGDTVAIAPGTYRETVVADNAGTSGNEIKFVGDPEGLYFDNEKPGRVRITDANSSEVAQGSNPHITSQQDYVEWHKVWLDGSRRGINFGVAYDSSRIIYDSVIQNGGASQYQIAVWYGSAIRCIAVSPHRAFHTSHVSQSIGLSGGNIFDTCQAENCLSIGGDPAFHLRNDASSYAYNCIALGAILGFRDPNGAGTLANCYALACKEAASSIAAGEATNCYYYGCDLVGDADFGSRGVTSLLDYRSLLDLLPWAAFDLTGGLLRQGDNTGPSFGAADTDIGGHRLRLKDSDLDIGPWSVSEPTDTPYDSSDAGLLDWGTYETNPPSIKITAEGDYAIQVPADSSASITVKVQAKHVSITGDKPQLILHGDSITEQTDTMAAVDDTWEELSVKTTSAVDEVLTVIFRARNSAGDCYFSDMEIG